LGIIGIELHDEEGNVVAEISEETHLLDRLLAPDEKKFRLLRYIDMYGDTVFNRLQMDDFLEEWNELGLRAKSNEEKRLVARVKDLIARCAKEPHLYLKFSGD
jgi:hypothetical protein